MATSKAAAKPSSPSNGGSEIRDLARRHGPAAFARLVALLESKNERLALAVAQEILNRAYGKPDSGRESPAEEAGPTVVVVRHDRGEALPPEAGRADSPPARRTARAAAAGRRTVRPEPMEAPGTEVIEPPAPPIAEAVAALSEPGGTPAVN